MKKVALISLLCALVIGAGSCAFGTSSENASSASSGNEVVSTVVHTGTGAFALDVGQTKTLTINQNISGKDYIKIILDCNVNLLGEYKYSDITDPSKVVTEPFYIEPSAEEIEFKQFFDAFRPNAIGAFDKKLISITLKNLDDKIANVNVKNITVTNREVPAFEKEVYLEKGGLKIGADLAMGGTLSYLEKLDYNGQTVDEVLDQNDNVTIGVNAKEGAKEHLSSSVNLINICDAGREFQQSYYAEIGGSMQENTGANGYERRWSFTATREGYYWPYNPVQGGDEVCNLSQIIDYEVTKNSIYVKVRAMDWGNGYARPEHAKHEMYETFKNGRTTKSYIENVYTIKGGMLYVENRFIDWNGFSDMENIPVHTLEIPAAYVVHPLSNYVCYVGGNPWNLSDTNYEREPDLPGWWLGEETHVNFTHPEDWFAWVNDEDFGVGVYVPNAGAYISGRNNSGRHISHPNNSDAKYSKMANDYLYNKAAPTSDYTSCYVGNTSYTAPIVNVRMKEYVPLSYTYVVAVDYLPIMRSAFKNINEAGIITNKGLEAWD
ncbi:MAG: hypothetical protein IKA57_05995 [Clostridia bacterium]|nr:hypothetical protein [Clostridia bacterium]